MSNFAKLFQVTPFNQVLLTIRYFFNEKKDVVTQFTCIGKYNLAIDVPFNNEDTANKVFDDYNNEKAIKFYEEMAKFVQNNYDKLGDSGETILT